MKKGSKIKEYKIYVNNKLYGSELAISKSNALANAKKRYPTNTKIRITKK